MEPTVDEAQAVDGPGPTDSHNLSRTTEYEDDRIAPNANDTVEGWNAPSAPKDLGQRVIPHIPNEDLWMLIRRFNKVGINQSTRLDSTKRATDKFVAAILRASNPRRADPKTRPQPRRPGAVLAG